MKITPELILSWGPCGNYDEDRIRDLVGDGMTPLEIMDLEISLRDRVWVIVEYMRHTDRHDELSRMACDMAEAVLPIYEEEYPGDDRPRRAMEARRAHLAGEISDEELEAARDDAYDAFAARRSIAYVAARAAARSAYRAADVVIDAAARDVVIDAAGAPAYAAVAVIRAADVVETACEDVHMNRISDILKNYIRNVL